MPGYSHFSNSKENMFWVNDYHIKTFDMKVYFERDQMGKLDFFSGKPGPPGSLLSPFRKVTHRNSLHLALLTANPKTSALASVNDALVHIPS